MNETSDQLIQRVADEIEQNKHEIYYLYEKRIKEKLSINPDRDSNLFLIIPQQIDNLVKMLVNYSGSEKTINKLAQEHSTLKDCKKVFQLEIVISEFILLREVIFEVLEKKRLINVEVSNVIWQFIVQSIQVAVSEFESQKIDEADQMHHELDTSDSINKKISSQMLRSHENEERYHTLIEGIEDYAVFTTDPDGIITSWNPGAERMKGYTYGEAIGNNFSMLYPPEGQKRDEPMNHLHTALTEGRYRGEGLRQRKNGDLFLADVYIRPIFKDGRHLGFAKVVSDLTERNKLIQEAEISHTVIVDLESEKEQRANFVLRLSHDLKGPLAVARAAVELIARHMKPDNQSKKYIDKSLFSIDRVNRMINDLLDANRISGGEKPYLNLQRWDFIKQMEYICEDFRLLGAKIVINTKCKQLFGEWDPEGVRRVFENLISNALKYGDNSCPVDITITDLGDQISVRVHNKGELIKETDQKSLFDQFRRTITSQKNRRGWGIGLSLVKGITEAHGGSVKVESYPIQGTTFTVNLPKWETDFAARI